MGEDDNFWPAGAPTHGPDGVCGPCSEIFYHGDGIEEVEIWNLVFTQFNRVGPWPARTFAQARTSIPAWAWSGSPPRCKRCRRTSRSTSSKPLVAATADQIGLSLDAKGLPEHVPSGRPSHPAD